MGRETGKGNKKDACYQNQSCWRNLEPMCNIHLGVIPLKKPSCWLLVTAAESSERDIVFIPLCLWPALHISRMDSMARVHSSETLLKSQIDWHLEVRLACTDIGAKVIWVGWWQHLLQDVAIELNLERWVVLKGGEALIRKREWQEQRMRNNDATICSWTQLRGDKMGGNEVAKASMWTTWYLHCRQ